MTTNEIQKGDKMRANGFTIMAQYLGSYDMPNPVGEVVHVWGNGDVTLCFSGVGRSGDDIVVKFPAHQVEKM